MTAPRWLSNPDLTGSSLKLWKEIAPSLYRAGRLHAANTEKLRVLVRLLALADAVAAQIEADGALLRDASGAPRQHPGVRALLDAQKQAEPLLRDFELWQ